MKACIMGSNLKQSLRGGGGRNVRISRFELRTIEARPKFTGSYKKKACMVVQKICEFGYNDAARRKQISPKMACGAEYTCIPPWYIPLFGHNFAV